MADDNYPITRVCSGARAGPASYATGGFVIDLRGNDMTHLRETIIDLHDPGFLLSVRSAETIENTPTEGQVPVKLFQLDAVTGVMSELTATTDVHLVTANFIALGR